MHMSKIRGYQSCLVFSFRLFCLFHFRRVEHRHQRSWGDTGKQQAYSTIRERE